ncbi:MAG: bacillithiol biosynthesis deacetylase BshB1 [Bacteroidetes bacterium]|nr:bacillithiol biosynthesis deacetylase BshB1 [Bacteroidota bacterium]
MTPSPLKLDILAFAAHPDDAELSCSGTLIKNAALGKKVGIVDLTTGDLGTRGTSEIRLQEAQDSAKIMGLSARENLYMPDGFFEESPENLRKIISAIRKYKPEIVLANAVSDRHPDHGRGSAIVSRATFLSGLNRIDTGQDRWRPKVIYHYIQFRYIQPDFVIDITDEWPKKLAAIKAFKSQFYDPNSDEPSTMIASEDFLKHVEARSREMGACIETSFGEGFTVERPLQINNILDTI